MQPQWNWSTAPGPQLGQLLLSPVCSADALGGLEFKAILALAFSNRGRQLKAMIQADFVRLFFISDIRIAYESLFEAKLSLLCLTLTFSVSSPVEELIKNV